MFDYSAHSATYMAQETGFHRTTIAEWIKSRKIKAASKPKPNSRYRIYNYEFNASKLNELRGLKPTKNHDKTWSATEVYILKCNMHLSDKEIARMIKRTPGAIKIKRCRLNMNTGS